MQMKIITGKTFNAISDKEFINTRFVFRECNLAGADFTKSYNTEVITFENCTVSELTKLPSNSNILMDNNV